jgi:hypothetical protein
MCYAPKPDLVQWVNCLIIPPRKNLNGAACAIHGSVDRTIVRYIDRPSGVCSADPPLSRTVSHEVAKYHSKPLCTTNISHHMYSDYSCTY